MNIKVMDFKHIYRKGLLLSFTVYNMTWINRNHKKGPQTRREDIKRILYKNVLVTIETIKYESKCINIDM